MHSDRSLISVSIKITYTKPLLAASPVLSAVGSVTLGGKACQLRFADGETEAQRG